MMPVATQNPANSRLKPKTVVEYNKTMGGLDEVDRKVKTYESIRKTIKWYRKVAFHFMDITIYNSFRIWLLMNSTSKLTYKDFLLKLIQEIFEKYPPVKTNARGRKRVHDVCRKSGNHFPKPVFRSDGNLKFSDCVLCKLNNKRTQTGYECTECHTRLCIKTNPSCFESYHTLPYLPKKRPLVEPNSQYYEVETIIP